MVLVLLQLRLDTISEALILLDFGFSAAANTELKFSKDSDSPVAGIVVVNDEDGKDDVFLKGKMKLNGSSDPMIDELPFTITVGGGDKLADIAE